MTRFQINNIELAYTDTGVGRPIVLIHGYPFNRALWDEQIPALSQSYRVVAPDLRGFGDSDASQDPGTMSHLAADIAALMDYLAVPRATICGLSMGGYVALAFYKQFASRVRALVLADTRAQADTEEAKQTRAQQAEKALSEGMAAALRGMAERNDQTELLPKISVPTLIVVGAEDAITPVADSEKMHHAIRGSRLVVLDHAGHVSNVERPQQFNDALLHFLTQSQV